VRRDLTLPQPKPDLDLTLPQPKPDLDLTLPQPKPDLDLTLPQPKPSPSPPSQDAVAFSRCSTEASRPLPPLLPHRPPPSLSATISYPVHLYFIPRSPLFFPTPSATISSSAPTSRYPLPPHLSRAQERAPVARQGHVRHRVPAPARLPSQLAPVSRLSESSGQSAGFPSPTGKAMGTATGHGNRAGGSRHEGRRGQGKRAALELGLYPKPSLGSHVPRPRPPRTRPTAPPPRLGPRRRPPPGRGRIGGRAGRAGRGRFGAGAVRRCGGARRVRLRARPVGGGVRGEGRAARGMGQAE
jgi:hypothetical protein